MFDPVNRESNQQLSQFKQRLKTFLSDYMDQSLSHDELTTMVDFALEQGFETEQQITKCAILMIQLGPESLNDALDAQELNTVKDKDAKLDALILKLKS